MAQSLNSNLESESDEDVVSGKAKEEYTVVRNIIINVFFGDVGLKMWPLLVKVYYEEYYKVVSWHHNMNL